MRSAHPTQFMHANCAVVTMVYAFQTQSWNHLIWIDGIQCYTIDKACYKLQEDHFQGV